jgi:EmrB/QacA subfamily drug resistance transporter
VTIRERGTLAAAILGSGIVFLDSTVVHVALPAIGRELPSGFFDPFAVQNLVYYAYLLTLSSLLIMAGGLSDNFGRRRMYLWGLIGFGATSILCAAAWSSEALIIARALQGAAGALLIPGSLAIITAAFDTEKQGRAFGIWASASAATTMLGPFIGGMLVDSISWRLVFWINVPIIAIAVWTTIRWVQDTETNSKGRLDPLGSVLAFLAIGGLSVGAIVGEQLQWRGPVPIIALTIGVLASIAFPIAMKRVTRPLIPPTLFRSRNFTVVNVSTFLIYGALYVMFALVVIFVQGTLGYNAAAAGLVAFPTTLILTLFSSKFGEISGKRGPRLFLTAGPILMGIGVLWLTRIPADSQAWIFGSGNESTIMPPASYLQDLLPAFLVFGTDGFDTQRKCGSRFGSQ